MVGLLVGTGVSFLYKSRLKATPEPLEAVLLKGWHNSCLILHLLATVRYRGEVSMNDKFVLFLLTISFTLPGWTQDDSVNQLPVPSTIALFASAALAIVLVKKFKR
jgi:hypothetical protein